MHAGPDAPWLAWPAERDGSRKGDPEAIHRLRVAVRRLKTARRLAGLGVPAPLRRLGRALGKVRIWDLHRALLESLEAPAGTAAARAREALLSRIGARRRRALAALRGRLHGKPMRPCRPPPRPGDRGLAARLSLPPEEPSGETLHALRLDLKALRDAAEWTAPAWPALPALRALVSALGAHRDWMLLDALLAKAARRWRLRHPVRAAGAEALSAQAAVRRRDAYQSLPPLARAALRAGLQKGPTP